MHQHLLRDPAAEISPRLVSNALQWLRGNGLYPKPISIHLDLTLRCTARCAHCRQWTWPRQPEYTLDELEQIFRVFKNWGVRTITLGGGNPLLHMGILEALQMADRHGFQVGIITEGRRFQEGLTDSICKYAHWIRFSLDGPCAEIHDSIRGRRGLFERVLANIRDLRSKRKGLRIGLNCVIQKQNLRCLEEMISLAERIGVDVLLFKVPHGSDPDGAYLPTRAEWLQVITWLTRRTVEETRLTTNLSELRSLIESTYGLDDLVVGRPVRTFYKMQRTHCFAPLFCLSCDSKGNAYPCCYLQGDTKPSDEHNKFVRNGHLLGNVLQDPGKLISNLEVTLKKRLFDLPASGYDACGCCTRFCRFNAALTELANRVGGLPVDQITVGGHMGSFRASPTDAPFL